jgi:hypothetical protein
MISALNTALLMLPKRAESSAREKLIETFVDVGPLFSVLSIADHQVIFGRRGTGKTHALAYLADRREKSGDAAIFVDLRNVGSNGGLYADGTVALSERATRLLVDTFGAIHDSLTEFCVTHAETFNLAETGPALDTLAAAITDVKVVGSIEEEHSEKLSAEHRGITGIELDIKAGGGFKAEARAESTNARNTSSTVKRSGNEILYVNFGATGAAFRGVVEKLGGHRVWILLDEWGSVPLALQPYLADLIRRSLLPVIGVTVKIAAIEHRSAFRQKLGSGDYIGIELGADVSADINLDDFMVFDNDADRATDFFRDLIGRHVEAAASNMPWANEIPKGPEAIIQGAFTEKRAMEEFVRACEGVPRDAINILSLAAQRALSQAISVAHVRVAARNWFQRDKEKAVSADDQAHKLLQSIIREVIGDRRARAFLLRSDVMNETIESLYDARVLHVLKRGISTHDQPGVRFDVFKLDYGCYVDLITTARAPLGLLPADESTAAYVDVPPDDYRSIRRAILDLEKLKIQ